MPRQSAIDSLDDFFAWALSFTNLEHLQGTGAPPAKRRYTLDSIRYLVGLFGNPQESYQVVHIAGSKGKGSTAHTVARLLAARGNRVGCYLSPHVSHFTERYLCYPDPLPRDLMLDTARTLHQTVTTALSHSASAPGAPPAQPTTFDILTCYAFCCFRAAKCDWAVIECGLGGRLDSTNVVTPAVTAITPIELEHTAYLGRTLASIAAEKAGIIKPTAPVILAPQPPRALRVLRAAAARAHTPAHYLPRCLRTRRTEITTRRTAPARRLFPAPLRVPVSFPTTWQTGNLGLAAMITAHIYPDISSSELAAVAALSGTLPGRYQVLHTAPASPPGPPLPGRYQVLHTAPAPTVADGAHTVRSLAQTLRAFTRDYGRQGTVIFGCSSDKRYRAMLRLLRGRFAHYIFTAAHSPRALPPARLCAAARAAGIPAGHITTAPARDAYHHARTLAPHTPLLICGSLHLIGDIPIPPSLAGSAPPSQ